MNSYIMTSEGFLKDFIYLFLEKGDGRERNIKMRQKQLAAFCTPPVRALAHQPGLTSEFYDIFRKDFSHSVFFNSLI